MICNCCQKEKSIVPELKEEISARSREYRALLERNNQFSEQNKNLRKHLDRFDKREKSYEKRIRDIKEDNKELKALANRLTDSIEELDDTKIRLIKENERLKKSNQHALYTANVFLGKEKNFKEEISELKTLLEDYRSTVRMQYSKIGKLENKNTDRAHCLRDAIARQRDVLYLSMTKESKWKDKYRHSRKIRDRLVKKIRYFVRKEKDCFAYCPIIFKMEGSGRKKQQKIERLESEIEILKEHLKEVSGSCCSFEDSLGGLL